MKPLVIYHANCTDGFGAAFAAWLKLGDEAEYLPMHYNTAFPYTSDLRQRDLYILDFSFPREVMDSLFANAKRVVWLDHHKTAFEMWCESEKERFYRERNQPNGEVSVIRLDNNKSGALLAWEYFYPGTEVPMLIQHIDDRDRWQFELDGSKELHAALASYKPWSFHGWKHMIFDWSMHGEDLIAEGATILRAQEQHVTSMAKQARECRIGIKTEQFGCTSEPGLAVNATRHISEVGHELANQSGTFGLVWYLGGDACVKCSLRSTGNYDVATIARCFGGGGHRNAAGFETDIDTLMGWLK